MNADYVGLLGFGTAATTSIALYVRPDLRPWWTSRWCFTVLLALSLFLGQRQAISANFQLWNPDESEMLAGALTLQQRPVFWRDVDGNSHGPLNQLPLLLPALVGARIDYTSARIVSALMAMLTLFCLQRTMRAWCREGAARLLVLPGWAFFIFNQDPETVQYTSELPSCLLVAVAAVLFARTRSAAEISPARCWWIALACGAAPLAKLQSAPITAWIGLVLLLQLFLTPGFSQAERWARIGASLGGALTPWLGFAGVAAANGAFTYFHVTYFEVNLLGYSVDGAGFNHAMPSIGTSFGLAEFVWPVGSGIVLAALVTVWRNERPGGRALLLPCGLVASSLFAIYAPHKPFPHYFILLIGPLVLLFGAVAGPLLDKAAERLIGKYRLLLAAAVLLWAVAPSVAHHFRHPSAFPAMLRSRPVVSPALVRALQHYTEPGDNMSVWGWQPALHVFTQTTAATRHLISFWLIQPSPWREFYRLHLLADLTARPPVVFVDTAGPADFYFHHPERERHESFPALAEFIRTRYVPAETVHGARIYLRRDRAAPARSGPDAH